MNANSVNTNFMSSYFLAEVIVVVDTKSFHFKDFWFYPHYKDGNCILVHHLICNVNLGLIR